MCRVPGMPERAGEPVPRQGTAGTELLAGGSGKAPEPSGEDAVLRCRRRYANSPQPLRQRGRQSPRPRRFQELPREPHPSAGATRPRSRPGEGHPRLCVGQDPPPSSGAPRRLWGHRAAAGRRQAEDGVRPTRAPGRSSPPPWHPLSPHGPLCFWGRGGRGSRRTPSPHRCPTAPSVATPAGGTHEPWGARPCPRQDRGSTAVSWGGRCWGGVGGQCTPEGLCCCGAVPLWGCAVGLWVRGGVGLCCGSVGPWGYGAMWVVPWGCGSVGLCCYGAVLWVCRSMGLWVCGAVLRVCGAVLL